VVDENHRSPNFEGRRTFAVLMRAFGSDLYAYLCTYVHAFWHFIKKGAKTQ
jgi:hypothetical protein